MSGGDSEHTPIRDLCHTKGNHRIHASEAGFWLYLLHKILCEDVLRLRLLLEWLGESRQNVVEGEVCSVRVL